MHRQYTFSKTLDKAIDKKTAEIVATIPDAKWLGIRTAVYINQEFVLVSDYDVDEIIVNDLMWQAHTFNAFFTLELDED